MNYRDFFKKNKAGSGKTILPEGVSVATLKKAIIFESANTSDLGFAARIALKHLQEDANYYDKISETSEVDNEAEDSEAKDSFAKDSNAKPSFAKDSDAKDEHCGACEDDMGSEDSGGSEEIEVDADSEEGMPKVGGALAIPHVGQPIHMSKIIQVGGSSTGKSASGELSGYTSAGGSDSSDKGGVPVKSDGDKETITAGGKKVDGSVASKSVGGEIVSGEGQKQQGGLNAGGKIAGTPKMKGMTNESIQQLLKESIRFDKSTGKWALKEDVKKNAGKKVDMKMGASYKVVQPTQCKTVEQDTARTNQYEPEISESTMEDEEVSMMQERFQSLANAPRNLKESELAEMNSLKLKLEAIVGNGTSYKIVAPCQAQIAVDDHSRKVQSVPDMTEIDMQGTMAAHDELDAFDRQHPTLAHQRKALGQRGKLASPDDVDSHRGSKLSAGKFADLEAIHREIEAQKAAKHAAENPEDKYDNTPYRGAQRDVPDAPPMDLTDDDLEDEEESSIKEAGIGAVQHRSFRIIADAPQNPKTRWSDEVQEGVKSVKKSDTFKQIEKSNKGSKKSKPLDNLKHKPTSKTKSGIVLQKK